MIALLKKIDLLLATCEAVTTTSMYRRNPACAAFIHKPQLLFLVQVSTTELRDSGDGDWVCATANMHVWDSGFVYKLSALHSGLSRPLEAMESALDPYALHTESWLLICSAVQVACLLKARGR